MNITLICFHIQTYISKYDKFSLQFYGFAIIYLHDTCVSISIPCYYLDS